jgi:UDP-N-acetylglucosamine acyltransferase
VAHDCTIGNGAIIANVGTLAGHVTIGDKSIVGGLAAIHQFVRVGILSIIGGCSKVVQDVPPYSTVDGHPTKVYGINSIGLKRAGIPNESISSLKRAFRILFHSGLSLNTALERIDSEVEKCPELSVLIDFMKTSKRGVSR